MKTVFSTKVNYLSYFERIRHSVRFLGIQMVILVGLFLAFTNTIIFNLWFFAILSGVLLIIQLGALAVQLFLNRCFVHSITIKESGIDLDIWHFSKNLSSYQIAVDDAEMTFERKGKENNIHLMIREKGELIIEQPMIGDWDEKRFKNLFISLKNVKNETFRNADKEWLREFNTAINRQYFQTAV
jgi:predicted tellurium resistance membrane protein TerC